jgi:hypothetical protein
MMTHNNTIIAVVEDVGSCSRKIDAAEAIIYADDVEAVGVEKVSCCGYLSLH